MTRKEAARRIKDGKGIKVELEVHEGHIKDVMISGDFFAFPIEEFENLQNALKSKHASSKEIDRVLSEYEDKITLSGVTFSDLRELLHELEI